MRRREALWRQAELDKELLQLNAIADVRRTWTNQLALGLQIEQTDRAVVQYKVLVENEIRKLRVGESTVFKLVDFENQLTNALISQITLYRQYAQNIANLRFLIGRVFSADDFDCIAVGPMTALPCRGGI